MHHHNIITVSLIKFLPSNVMSVGEMPSQLDPETRSLVRCIEQNHKKITDAHFLITLSCWIRKVYM